ncbi:hypothetical protein PF004_g9737 [Phytophthora fragariae]|uniref:Transmembrane protein n=1 Tax=Phytophthora fragariae TaxID=53985 RepID=A0A6G0P2Z9_9STRA|nr:hypothetical protein PF004_g9737 [Phytophthora fragariae]
MGTKDGVSAGRKPWRFYYVMALPLSGSSGVTQDKLQEMTDMTTAIEQREEEYLHKVAAKNAAALEAAREDKQKTPMASHVAWVLRRLHVLSAALLLLMVALLYVWYMHDDGRDHVPPSLVRAVAIIVGVLLALNVAGWVAASRRSVNGARLLLLVGVALVVCLALGLDELNILRRTQSKLNEALTSSEDALTQDSMALILNGGTAPSLVQRFVLDSPSAFIWWLGEHCADSPTKLTYGSVVIDRREFFSPLWNEDAKSCVAATLGTCVRIDAIAEPIILVELVMLVLQVLFTGGFLAVWEPSAAGKTSKRRRQPSQLKPTGASYSQDTSSALSTALFTRLLVFGTALFGSSNAIASTDLLHFCSIADFHAVFTWMVVVCLLSGLSALLAALFVGCGWKQQLATVLLVLAVASEVYMLAEFVKLAARLIGPDISAEINQSQIRELREVYVKASSQTCSSIKRWISHVCVGMSNSEHPADFDSSCQHEFVALLVASFNFTDTYLAWSIGVKLVLLMQLIWPALRQAVATVLNYVRCISSRDEVSAGTVETSLQQSSPPVDYDEALDMYLTSLRVRDPARLATEREAFEKEWSIRTGRKLADVRTPRVVVAASDFGAIVRTLMLRRLTAICRLDLSLSVSSDGKMVLVHIFASDNLLIATLCEMETYRLQFADAVDPGRSFWHDKKEVNADQKVLDANTVKHKLKLLLAENAMHPKEAVWFSGESLARVSARVHALSRISRASRGIIRCRNPAPAFASYSPSIQRQFIYKKYPNRLEIPDTYRRSVVLRTVDCIRITRHIIDGEFDTNAAISSGLVASLHCLHSASRFDFNSRGALASAWVTFWRPTHLPAQLGTRIILILSAVKRFNEIQSGEQSYGRKEREEETMLSTYPGGDKDYAQLRQNALELCCIRQRPEPEGVQSREDNDDDIGLGLWAPWVLLMLKISVPTALALAAFTADNYIDISIERRVGWWLIGVLGIWLVAQLLWFLVPRESRQAEEARARNTFLVDRYFGHTDVNEQKASARGELHSIEKEAISLQDPPPSAKQSLCHYEERLELLQRLNVALRKREEIRAPYIVTDEVAVHATTAENLVQDAREEATEELYSTEAPDAEAHMAPSVDDDAMQRVSDSSEEMIVGYFRPVRGAWPSPPEQPAEAVEEVKEDAPVNIMEFIEAPAPQPPRRGSVFPGSLPLSEIKISHSGEDVITGSRIEIGGDSTGHPAPMRLSKLFKRIPASPPTVVPSSASDDAEIPVAPPTSPFVPVESSFPQPDLDPGIFAPTQVSARGASSPEGSHDEMLEEKLEVPVSTTEEPRISIGPPSLEVDPPSRPFSPRLSFLRRKSQSPASTHSDNGSDRGSEAGASEQTLLRQLSPRLSFFTRKSKRSSSKVSDSEESKISVGGESASVPEPPAPRKLSKLFKRVQPPSTATPTPPPPPVDTAAFAFERIEVEDSVVNPASSVRDQFDFLSDAHSETTSLQSSLPIQRRRSSGSTTRPPSPPPVYAKVDLSGLEAVREAANRRQFDFSADEQVWED